MIPTDGQTDDGELSEGTEVDFVKGTYKGHCGVITRLTTMKVSVSSPTKGVVTVMKTSVTPRRTPSSHPSQAPSTPPPPQHHSSNIDEVQSAFVALQFQNTPDPITGGCVFPRSPSTPSAMRTSNFTSTPPITPSSRGKHFGGYPVASTRLESKPPNDTNLLNLWLEHRGMPKASKFEIPLPLRKGDTLPDGKDEDGRYELVASKVDEDGRALFGKKYCVHAFYVSTEVAGHNGWGSKRIDLQAELERLADWGG
jgi:hypothetical protein